ncbi:DUF1569 domain-containing protein [Flavimarina sp. Hel_I_48]|uniref:DUF1569 domain-containing protein n=1 Tax=Flavimarina sp. Hel_I_48 TaxID=1392488 RepID=UPI0004DF2119|nr:DUF1569 domain-containing protein [Flavimarina sp. Hel_I_48]
MENLLEDKIYDQIKNRLTLLNIDSKPQWGKMTVAQTLHHCQKPLEIALGKKDYGLKSNLVAKWFFKKMMYNDKSWPRGMTTPKTFKVEQEKGFSEEKNAILKLLKEFHNKKSREKWPKHPVFGQFTPEQVGKMQYKHLDHHFRQFGV